jgi:hypothetical protein
MPTLRIAILECDTPLDKVLDKYGSYGDIFTALLKQASKEVTSESGEKVQVECTNYDVVSKQDYPEDLDKVDAILMTGSSKFSRDTIQPDKYRTYTNTIALFQNTIPSTTTPGSSN